MARPMRFFADRRGASRIKTIITLLVIAAIAYTVIKFVPPYVNYLKIENAAYDTMNSVGGKGDDVILDRFLRMTKDIKPKLTAENAVVQRDESGPATLVVDYSVNVVLIKGKLEKLLTFHIEEKPQR
jgi:hypothetical protein